MTMTSNITDRDAYNYFGKDLNRRLQSQCTAFHRRSGKDKAGFYHLMMSLPTRTRIKLRGVRNVSIWVHPTRGER